MPKNRGVLGKFGAFGVVLFFLPGVVYGYGRGRFLGYEYLQFKPGQVDEPNRSKVEFNPQGAFKIRLATLSVPDSIGACPIESAPSQLLEIVNDLTSQVSAIVSKVKDHQGERCAALTTRLQSSQNLLGTAFQYQIVTANAMAAGGNQMLINQQTLQASAVTQFLMTTSDVLRSCTSKDSFNDLQVVQKLISQVMTLSGLFVGGWEGVTIAAVGQVVGALPLFNGDADNTLKQLNLYAEMNDRGSFLCQFRQIRKTTCLLFATEEDQMINGLDLSFQTGPARTTIESIENFRQDLPATVADMELLGRIRASADTFMMSFSGVEAKMADQAFSTLSSQFRSSLDELNQFCGKIQPLEPLKDARLTSPEIQGKIENLMRVCGRSFRQQPATFNDLTDVYWQLYSLSLTYQDLIKDESTELGRIGRTLESLKYFNQLKKSLSDYSSSRAGNQLRMHFLDLSRSLTKMMAVSSFKRLFKADLEKLTRRLSLKYIFKNKGITRDPSERPAIRSRALKALLDLCMTFDPTLGCLLTGNPKRDPLLTTWRTYCAGPRSFLCRETLSLAELDLLLKDQHYRPYYESLCGVPSPVSATPSATSSGGSPPPPRSAAQSGV